MRGERDLLSALSAVVRRQHAREAPIIGIDLINHNVRVLRLLAENSLQGFRDFPDNLLLLLASDPVTRQLDIHVRHFYLTFHGLWLKN